MTAWFYPYYSGLTKDIFIAFGPKFIIIIVFGAEGTKGTKGPKGRRDERESKGLKDFILCWKT